MTNDASAPEISNFTGTWTSDPSHTHLSFVARHLMISKVRGEFKKAETTLVIGDTADDISIDVEIDAASISTNEEQRDGHLRSPDFLDVENFPTLSFKSTKTESVGHEWKITGDLTIRGVTQPIELDVTWEGEQEAFGSRRMAVSGEAELDRTKWGLTWNQALETGGVLVSEKVKLLIDLELIQS